VPFVALDDTTSADAVDAARSFGAWASATLGTPIFFYGHADERHRTLPATRSSAFRTREPDLVPAEPRPGVGAIVVGARPVLVAVNCELDRDDRALAVAIAREVREHEGGGLPGVRALGFRLASRERVQVSMNLVDLERTGIERACTDVRTRARAADADVARVELVGLLPAAELARCSRAFVDWAGLTADDTIEARLARR
jgi:glutamate formiminotransferase